MAKKKIKAGDTVFYGRTTDKKARVVATEGGRTWIRKLDETWCRDEIVDTSSLFANKASLHKKSIEDQRKNVDSLETQLSNAKNWLASLERASTKR